MFFHTVKLLQEAQDSNDGQDWDEEDELAYIENGEPLLQNVDNRFARSPKGRYTPASLLLALPFVAIVWVFHPLHQFASQVFEGLVEKSSHLD